MASSTSSFPVKKVPLNPPLLSNLASAITPALSANFTSCSCTISTPPDLTSPPYNLASAGLTGSARVIDIGTPSNLMAPDFSKQYDLLAIARDQAELGSESGMAIGAGAGPYHELGLNSELMPNVAWGTAAAGPEMVRNRTHYAKIKSDESACCAPIPNESTQGAFIGNLFASAGKVGPVLHITAKGRTGKLNFTETIQAGLKETFGDKLISVGGVFLIKKGQANLHVMPTRFPEGGFKAGKDVHDWLKYFDWDFSEQDQLVCLSVFHNGEQQGLELRVEHTHCFTSTGEEGETKKGGHYHYDVEESKEEIEYEGWFNVAEYVYRVDGPESVYA